MEWRGKIFKMLQKDSIGHHIYFDTGDKREGEVKDKSLRKREFCD